MKYEGVHIPETNETVQTTKTSSDGTVKIAVERYNELVEQAAVKPAVINKTVVQKTPEMLAKEQRVMGGTLMGLGASSFTVGALLFKSGRIK